MPRIEAATNAEERLRPACPNAKYQLPKRSTNPKPSGPWSGTFHELESPRMEALERQADSLICALKPDEASICLRQNVFRFVEKLITDCFSEIPVRSCGLNCDALSIGPCVPQQSVEIAPAALTERAFEHII